VAPEIESDAAIAILEAFRYGPPIVGCPSYRVEKDETGSVRIAPFEVVQWVVVVHDIA
jgi:hypothetical protein